MQHSEPSAVDKDNWFSTGDVASMDPLGYMRITDRSKDVIKSGGEWISSIEIENMAVSHEQVRLRYPLTLKKFDGITGKTVDKKKGSAYFLNHTWTI